LRHHDPHLREQVTRLPFGLGMPHPRSRRRSSRGGASMCCVSLQVATRACVPISMYRRAWAAASVAWLSGVPR
jgi:hypothetical protein